MKNLISEDYLMHHGVKGMKWGVRKDKISETKNKLLTPNKKGRTPAEKITNDIYRASTLSSNAVRRSRRPATKTSVPTRDPKSMSYRELQQAVNRINLERQYRSLTSYDTRSGREKAADILDTFGTIAAIGGSALSIYAVLRGLRI